MVDTAASYVGLSRSSFSDPAERRRAFASEGYWKRDLTALVDECGGKVPPLLLSLGRVILSAGIHTEGIFRKAPKVSFSSYIRALNTDFGLVATFGVTYRLALSPS